MGYFFLILFVVFILWPLIRVGYKIYCAQKQARKAYEQFFNGTFGGESRENPHSPRQPEPEAPPQHKKKIPKDVGEYVDFKEERLSAEELRARDEAAQKARKSFKAEKQITDIEWEDI